MATQSSLELDRLRRLAGHPAQDNFFRGLVSSRLGSDRIVDDELIDLIVGNPILDDILDDLCNTPAGWAKINKAIEETFSESRSPGEADSNGAYERVCRLIWIAAVDDPRFNIILKQAQDEAKMPPPVVRGSGLWGVLGVLDKIRSALTSGAAKHSDATLSGSVLAAILAGALGSHIIAGTTSQNPPDGSTGVNSPLVKQLTTAVDSLNASVTAQTQIVNQLNTNITAQTQAVNSLNSNVLVQTVALSKPPQTYRTFITNWPTFGSTPSNAKIETFNKSLTGVEQNVTQIRKDLDTTNQNVRTLQGQVDFASTVKSTLDQIAYGIGPSQKEKGLVPLVELPSLRKSSKDIADALVTHPQPSTGNPTSSPKQESQSVQADTTASTAPNGVSVASSLETLAGIAKTEDNEYVRSLPVQSVISKEDSTAIFERATDGTPCSIRWRLVARTASDVTLSVFDENCQTSPPRNPYELVIGHTNWQQVQGTKSKVTLARIERTKWWSVFDKSAVLAVSRK